ncbi:ABC transporter permease [Wenxinia saemankumensis]|uniref:Transport permease protein n=1 Tax=Wenxinia saemankumensis TaxID=1447782 RepID=A0A1M6CBH7_9RHOB|nr:ABC transporter permease [Wenxinia saemankumensis]SHI58347.1 ABC-2 type transport system permease protein [Wenxinia saemankumensis]
MTYRMQDGETIGAGTRRFGRVNWIGTWTLAEREVKRFLNVWSQTILGPLVTAGLFLLIFSIAIGPGRPDVMGVPFMVFLVPGLMTMTVIQNAFANTSSSMAGAKVQGNIVDTLMPPLSPAEILTGYLAGGIARGLIVAVAIALGAWLALGVGFEKPLWALTFAVLGSIMMGALGLMAGIYAQKFDQLAAITNFIVTPLAFLSGTFYSLEAMPPLLRTLSHANPVFYVIDGVRYGMIGVSDSSPLLGLGVLLVSCAVVCLLAWQMLRRGYRLKA